VLEKLEVTREPPKGSAAKRLESIAPWAWTAALVVLFFWFWPLEWSYPYCNTAFDGPSPTAYGLPLPALEHGPSSLEYDVLPHALAFDVVTLGFFLFWPVRWLLRRVPAGQVRLTVSALGLAAGLVLLSDMGVVAALAWQPVGTFSDTYRSYLDYRPVGWDAGGGRECRPSEFWFGPVSEPRRRWWNAAHPDRPLERRTLAPPPPRVPTSAPHVRPAP